MKKSRLTLYIFLSLIAGIAVGEFLPQIGKHMQPLANLFLNLIRMIIAPLLFSVIVTGIASHGNTKSLGKLALKTFVYFAAATSFALIIGLSVGLIFKPGADFAIAIPPETAENHAIMANAQVHNSLSDMIVNMVPTSIIDAMATGNLLQIVVFSVLFSVAICAAGERAKPVLDCITSLSEVMFKLTSIVMNFAPVGVFGAIAYTIAENGAGILVGYAKIIFALYFALLLFLFTVLNIACRIVGISVISLIKAIKDPAMLAFTTSTSEAALPSAMEIMENFGVPKNIVGFVMPTGYTFNLDGSTLYLALAMLFSLQIADIHVSIPQMFMIMFTLMIASKGIAAVPRVALVILAGTLSGFGYSILGVVILLGVDQLLDMGRTTVNLIGNCVATVVVARWENEFNYTKMDNFIAKNKKQPIKNSIIFNKELISGVQIEEHSNYGQEETIN